MSKIMTENIAQAFDILNCGIIIINSASTDREYRVIESQESA